MTDKQTWITQCAQRLIGMYGYGLAEAESEAQTIADEQAWRYGDDPARWIAPWAAAEPLLPTGMYRVGKCCYWRSGNSTILLAPAWRGLHVGQLGWSREETQETYWRLQNFADDWDAPGMEAYDDL